jgi:hypothetical protein
MKKLFFTAFLLTLFFVDGNAQRKKDFNDSWDGNFDIMYMPEVKTIPNIVALKVTGVGKTREEATWKSKRNASAAVLFRGVPGSSVSSPLLGREVNKIHDEQLTFFNEFFAIKGEFNRFVNMPAEVAPQDIIKIKSIGYEVSAACQVNYAELRKYMEDKGFSKKFGL